MAQLSASFELQNASKKTECGKTLAAAVSLLNDWKLLPSLLMLLAAATELLCIHISLLSPHKTSFTLSLLLGLELLGAPLATPRCAGSHEPWNLFTTLLSSTRAYCVLRIFFSWEIQISSLLGSPHTWALLLHAFAFLFKLLGEFSHSDERTRECSEHVQDLRWYVEEICSNFSSFSSCVFMHLFATLLSIFWIFYMWREKNRAESAWRWGWIMSWTLCQCLAATRQAQHNIAVMHFTRVFFPSSHILNYWCNDKNLFQQQNPTMCWVLICMVHVDGKVASCVWILCADYISLSVCSFVHSLVREKVVSFLLCCTVNCFFFLHLIQQFF